jgi:hypothetical protein
VALLGGFVAGVPALALFAIFRKMKMGPQKGGMVQMSLRLNKEDNAIFVRALERVDAELRADEELGLSPEHSRRTPRQRRFDALMVLIDQTCTAVEAHGSHPNQS